MILAKRLAFLLALLVLVANLAACGSGQHATTTSAGTKTLTYRLKEPFPLYVQIQGPGEAVITQAHSLRAHLGRTPPIIVRNAPGHAVCTFPGLQGNVTVRFYGDKRSVSAWCKHFAKALGG